MYLYISFINKIGETFLTLFEILGDNIYDMDRLQDH